MVGPNRPIAPIAGMIDLSKATMPELTLVNTNATPDMRYDGAHLLFGVPRGPVARDTPTVGRVNQAVPSCGCEKVRARQKSRAVSLGYF